MSDSHADGEATSTGDSVDDWMASIIGPDDGHADEETISDGNDMEDWMSSIIARVSKPVRAHAKCVQEEREAPSTPPQPKRICRPKLLKGIGTAKKTELSGIDPEDDTTSEPDSLEGGTLLEHSAENGFLKKPSSCSAAQVRALISFRIKVASKTRKDLVTAWREVSRPRRGGAIRPQPRGCKEDFPWLMETWLEKRQLLDAMERVEDQHGWAVYKCKREPIIRPQANWETAFHGTWWYPFWLILESGILLESNDHNLGHDFWEPGVYCSPRLETARWYARPQVLFSDGVYYRVVLELRVDPAQRKRNRGRGGMQWVHKTVDVALQAVWVQVNAPPQNGEERVNEWDPALEAIPPGRTRPETVINPRVTSGEPWPELDAEDEESDSDDNQIQQSWQMPRARLGHQHFLTTEMDDANELCCPHASLPSGATTLTGYGGVAYPHLPPHRSTSQWLGAMGWWADSRHVAYMGDTAYCNDDEDDDDEDPDHDNDENDDDGGNDDDNSDDDDDEQDDNNTGGGDDDDYVSTLHDGRPAYYRYPRPMHGSAAAMQRPCDTGAYELRDSSREGSSSRLMHHSAAFASKPKYTRLSKLQDMRQAGTFLRAVKGSVASVQKAMDISPPEAHDTWQEGASLRPMNTSEGVVHDRRSFLRRMRMAAVQKLHELDVSELQDLSKEGSSLRPMHGSVAFAKKPPENYLSELNTTTKIKDKDEDCKDDDNDHHDEDDDNAHDDEEDDTVQSEPQERRSPYPNFGDLIDSYLKDVGQDASPEPVLKRPRLAKTTPTEP